MSGKVGVGMRLSWTTRCGISLVTTSYGEELARRAESWRGESAGAP